MSVFILKIIAVICMFCDHIRYLSPSFNTETTRTLGRIAFPIFAFLITEGYIHTKNVKKYLLRLLIFALISQIPFWLFGCGLKIFEINLQKFEIHLNVMFTLLLGAISILGIDKIKNKFLKILPGIICCVLGHFCDVDYGAHGVGVVIVFYVLRDYKILKNVLVCSIFCGYYLYKCEWNPKKLDYCMPYFYGYTIVPFIIYWYNGKLGKYKLKYFFYLFYPVHMVLLFVCYKLFFQH